jgi:hypothetical protein
MPQRESWGPEPSDERMRLKSSRPAAGRLVAYDAEHFTNGVIRLIWDSQAEGIPFDFNKFNPPVVSGGKVFLPTYEDYTLVLGLA